VPFGPRASQAGVAELDPAGPVRPDDFWGEDSASIHDALQPPEAAAPAPIVVEVAAPLRGRPGSPFHSGARAWVHGIRLRLPRVRPWALPVRFSISRFRAVSAPRVRPISLVVAGAAALACAAIALAALGATPGGAPQRASLRAAQTIGAFRTAALAIDPAMPAWVGHRHTGSRHRAPGVRHRGHAPARGAKASSPSSVSSPRGRGTPPHATGSSSQTVAGAASSAPATAAAGGASAGSTGSGGDTAAGPQGPGAPFGPGHLG
jgi:hypothetical protein